jgi:Arc/MetJ-type ribon-helix-helix transcriptional regulator
MDIRLSPKLAAVVEQDVAPGRFASAEEYIAAAVELLHERAQGWNGETLEEFNAKLEELIAQAERGEVADEQQVREGMRKMKAEWVSSKKTA